MTTAVHMLLLGPKTGTVNADIDEIKFFYKALSQSGILNLRPKIYQNWLSAFINGRLSAQLPIGRPVL